TCIGPLGSFSPCPTSERARWPPYAPFCSDGIGLSVLPGALRLLGLAPVGCRRLTRSRVNVLAGRFILDAGCVVSAPLPALSGPSACAGPPTWGGGTFLSDPEGHRRPSAVSWPSSPFIGSYLDLATPERVDSNPAGAKPISRCRIAGGVVGDRRILLPNPIYHLPNDAPVTPLRAQTTVLQGAFAAPGPAESGPLG